MEFTKELAKFCSSVSMESLPAEVVHKAKLCILDYVANVYGSLELETVGKVADHIRSLGGGQRATVLGCGFKTDAQHAAFFNGVTAEAIEAQDGLRFGGNHPGAAVIPAALAVAEERNCSGAAVIEAVVAGYEAANRASAAMHPWHTLGGFLPTGTCGTFGAAVAASRLMGHDPATLLNALGNAGYLLPISMAEQLMGGYTVKIVQGGQAASAGIMAAGLAGCGVTGAPYVIEGSALNGGFAKITTIADPTLDRITEGLGAHYSIMDIYFKPFTACRHTHGAAQAAMELAASEPIALETVVSVVVHTYGIAELAVGKPVSRESSFVSAQFSIPYVVAVCLLDGQLGPGQLTEARIADSVVMALAGKVTVKTDEALNAVYPEKTSSRVEMTLADGRMLTRQVDIPKGDPRDPMTAEDLAEKIRRFSVGRKSVRVEEIVETVMNLEQVETIHSLVETI